MLRALTTTLVLSWVLALPASGQETAERRPPEPAELGSEAVVTHAEGVEPVAGIDRIYRTFHRAYRSMDAATVAATYDEGAYYLSPGHDLRHGQGSVQEGFDRLFGWARENGASLDIVFEIVERHLGADLGYDVGYFTMTTRREGGAEGVNRGKFVVVLRPGEEGWRILVDSFSPVQQASAGDGP